MCSAHTKQKLNKSAASFVFTPTACWFQWFLFCLLNPPQITHFFFPQNRAVPMVAAPESKQGQGFSAPPRASSSAVMAEPVTLSCVVVKWLQRKMEIVC